MKTTHKRIELDWTKLLGFNQVKTAQTQSDSKNSRSLIGSRIGVKVGSKVTDKLDAKAGN